MKRTKRNRNDCPMNEWTDVNELTKASEEPKVIDEKSNMIEAK